MESLEISLFLFFIALLLHGLPCLSFTSFVFGDSLVDAGNNQYIFTLSKADSPPYGIDFTSSGGQPTGRFTNGRTTSDIIGQALGAKSFPPPYLSPNSASNAITGGLNYASGASGILDETGTLFVDDIPCSQTWNLAKRSNRTKYRIFVLQIGRIPLEAQINYFQESRTYMVNAMGENGTRKFLRNAIFSITIGSNDVLNYFQPSIPLLNENKVSPIVFQDFMVSNFTAQLERLYGLGARKLVVVGVGPLGCIPFLRAIYRAPSGKCSAEVNSLVQGYNGKLRAALDRLNQELGPDAIFVYGNSYDIFTRILQSYRQYGFEDAEDPCCGGYFPPFICFRGNNANTSSFLCANRSKYVFWDAYHPTEAANIIVAKNLLNGDRTISSPINIRALYRYNQSSIL